MSVKPANDEMAIKLEDVVITEVLQQRPRRAPDYKSENDALRALAQHLLDDPDTLLQRLVALAVRLCACGSVGVNIPETLPSGERVFRWAAVSGLYAKYEGMTVPRDTSPSSIALDRGATQLFAHPGRFFTSLAALDPPVVEGLVLELRGRGDALGTLWIATHDRERQFDLEDVRLMTSLTAFTAAALQAHRQRNDVRQANEIKDRFLATLSHELRTLLTAILGWTRMMRLGAVEPHRIPHALETIERNAQLQMDLVSDLLDLERIRMGTLRLNPQTVALQQMVRGVIDGFAPAAHAKTLTIGAQLESTVDPVWADSSRLEQVLRNLLSNAVKFTPDGGRIDVTLRQHGHMAEVAVTDTGIGIASEALPHVFEAFMQGDIDHRTVSQGLGLGLAIVRHLVALHGGTVSARSDGPGCGTTFVVTLPTSAGRPLDHAAEGGQASSEPRRTRAAGSSS
jgi:signal transduction histidine kinase